MPFTTTKVSLATSKDRLRAIIKEVNESSGDWRAEINLQPHSLDDPYVIEADLNSKFGDPVLTSRYINDTSIVSILDRYDPFGSVTSRELEELENKCGNDFGFDNLYPCGRTASGKLVRRGGNWINPGTSIRKELIACA